MLTIDGFNRTSLESTQIPPRCGVQLAQVQPDRRDNPALDNVAANYEPVDPIVEVVRQVREGVRNAEENSDLGSIVKKKDSFYFKKPILAPTPKKKREKSPPAEEENVTSSQTGEGEGETPSYPNFNDLPQTQDVMEGPYSPDEEEKEAEREMEAAEEAAKEEIETAMILTEIREDMRPLTHGFDSLIEEKKDKIRQKFLIAIQSDSNSNNEEEEDDENNPFEMPGDREKEEAAAEMRRSDRKRKQKEIPDM